jgi:hypothetical protein
MYTNIDQDTYQATGTPVTARFTVSKMTQGTGQGPDLGQNGPGHVPDPELGQGPEPVTEIMLQNVCYQTLYLRENMNQFSTESISIHRPGTIGTPSVPVRRGSHKAFAPPQTKGPGPVTKSGTYADLYI